MRSLLPMLVVVCVALPSGCQHDVTIRSWPERATVADDEGPIAKTPAIWSEDIGPDRPRVLSLQLGEEVREVVVDRSVIAWPAVGAWTAAGAAACCALNGVGFSLWGILMAATSGENALFAPGVTIPIGAVLLFGGASAGLLYGRQGPDEIMVDFEGGRVVSFPEGVASWNGESPGAVPLSVLLPEEAPIESTDATPASDTGDTPSTSTNEAGAPSEAAPSEAAPSEGAPSEAAPSEVAPSEAAPSEAAPSEAAPSEGAPSEGAPNPADKLVDDEPPTRF